MRRCSVVFALAFIVAATACSDAVAPARSTALTRSAASQRDESEGRGVFQRYVAIGTSLSMGWQSDGVIAATQETSWPAQLAMMAHRSITQPYIDGTGCRSPLIPVLALGKRLSGEGAGQDPSTLSCSGLRAAVEKPVQNLAINAATTHYALYTTPENTQDAANARLIGLVLQSGMTQVSSMVAQNPKFVSVELGGNEILNARSGIVIPRVTVTPYSDWAPDYDKVLDAVQAATKEAVLVGLIDDVSSFPAFRTGNEMWQQRFLFGALHVTVSTDCMDNQNLLFVPVVVPTAAATAAAVGSYTLHCADQGFGKVDFIITPADVAAIKALMAQMSAHIQQEAERRGFAYFALQSLYGRPDAKGQFNPIDLLTSAQPYGPLISLDGVHPTAEGARVLAEAAARAIDARYHHSILSDDPALIASK